MNIGIVTVTYNSEKYIADQIRAVEAASASFSCRQVVVDNASADKTREIVLGFPNVFLIENTHNVGFSAANNQGLRHALFDYVLFLNPDMRPDSGMLRELVSVCEKDSSVAIAGPRLVDAGGQLSPEAAPRRLPRLIDLFFVITKIGKIFPFFLRSYLYQDKDFTKSQEVESVRGACMLVRKSFIEECGFVFDPRYFFWFEDVDICQEASVRGKKILYVAAASCTDFIGQSVKKQTTLWKQYQFTKSMRIYVRKWFPLYKRFLLDVLLTVYLLVLALLRRIL